MWIPGSVGGGFSGLGVRGQGGGRVVHYNDNDDTYMTPEGSPGFVALGLKTQSWNFDESKGFSPTLEARALNFIVLPSSGQIQTGHLAKKAKSEPRSAPILLRAFFKGSEGKRLESLTVHMYAFFTEHQTHVNLWNVLIAPTKAVLFE